jgi:maltose alpha-D-glucosyltransferase / alpha-amylase
MTNHFRPADRSDWYKDALIYEVHVRAFRDSNGDGIGDFPGLLEKLDYIADLGVTALWLLPFYPSPLRDGGYDISDYFGIHPSYGTLEDFKSFLAAAHERGIRVITELVINHTSSDHPWFQRARLAAPGSSERDFYVWSESPDKYREARIIFQDFESSNWTWDPVAGSFYWHRFYSHQPDLNFDNPEVRAAIFEVFDYWMELGVDGVRLDAVPYLFEREGTSCENLPETHAFLRDLRAHVDAKFEHRMLLAEANQWPSDAAAYFGSGDECHMNFHFPLMPRLFMALQSEDSFPIVDILNQTPKIPESCQWATFLRNHDELTLEMVTDEDRDYMYRVYAEEARARINLGIRRRLFPLLRDRRRVELLNALLFALPGTPVLYYGDEIGMGDNIYLGDRDGVRTPMQWSSDRNGGFSSAAPHALYLPMILDSEYHYQSVNVELSQKNPASLLWWTKRFIALRKQYPVFGRGRLEFLAPDNGKVLAFMRVDADTRLLVVANLSRQVQCAHLDLSAHAGSSPRELVGGSAFPAISDQPYRLTLGPYDIFLFELPDREAAVSAPPSAPLELNGAWSALGGERGRNALARRLLAYSSGQRWYRSKARAVKSVSLEDTVRLPAGAEEANFSQFLGLLGVELTSGARETYFLPLRFAAGDAARSAITEEAPRVVSELHLETPTPDGSTNGALVEAIGSRELAQELLRVMREGRRIASEHGFLSGQFFEAPIDSPPESELEPRFAAFEQSNSSIVYGKALLLKLLRVIEEGPNLELEMARFLASSSKPHASPRVLGSLEWSQGKRSQTVGILSEFVENSGTAWGLTQEALAAFFEAALTAHAPLTPVKLPGAPVAECSEEVPQTLVALASPYFSRVRLLAERTAELHTALASSTTDAAFASEPFGVSHQHSIYQNAHTSLVRVFQQLRTRLGGLPEASQSTARALLARESFIDARLKAIVSRRFDTQRIRCHGDYHLGQLLFTGDNFVIIDFEGEPAKSPTERRYKRCPLRDVACMLRSFDYATQTALRSPHLRAQDLPVLLPWANAFRAWVQTVFTREYLTAAKGQGFVPQATQTVSELLDFFLLEKAIYEIGYELNNRPDWLDVPLLGLTQLLPAAH